LHVGSTEGVRVGDGVGMHAGAALGLMGEAVGLIAVGARVGFLVGTTEGGAVPYVKKIAAYPSPWLYPLRKSSGSPLMK
jgi:hypothetical protein